MGLSSIGLSEATANKIRRGWRLMVIALALILTIETIDLVVSIRYNETPIIFILRTVTEIVLAYYTYMGRLWAQIGFVFRNILFSFKGFLAAPQLWTVATVSTHAHTGHVIALNLFLAWIYVGVISLDLIASMSLLVVPSIQTYFAYARSEFGSELVE